MTAMNRAAAGIAAAPILILGPLAFGQSAMEAVEPEAPVESFAGRELAGYGYGEHFCWALADTAHARAEALADTAHARAEALAAATGGTRTPVYTFELHTGQRWDMCLWSADGDWEGGWKYRNCGFARDGGAADGFIHRGRAHPDAGHEYAEYDHPGPYDSGPQDETIVYAGPIAGRMICADAREPYVPARADLLLFEGDTRAGEADDADDTGGGATEPGGTS